MVATQREDDIQTREKGANEFGSGISQVFEKENSKIQYRIRYLITIGNILLKFISNMGTGNLDLKQTDFRLDGFYIKNVIFLKDDGSQQGGKKVNNKEHSLMKSIDKVPKFLEET